MEDKVEPSLSKENTKVNLRRDVVSNTEAIRIKPQGEVAWVEFDLPNERANKLSGSVLLRLEEVIKELSKSSYKAAILVSRKKGIYIAGADIEEIKKIKSSEEAQAACQLGQEIFNELEKLPLTTIAAVSGACMGGGCEMILACDYRICSDDSSTRIGLPEVKLGVIPGFGGTQRLPRLVGLQAGLDIILAGKAVDGKKALKIGLVSQNVPAPILEEQALKLAKDVISGKLPKKPSQSFKPKTWNDSILEGFAGKMLVFSQARKALLKQTKGKYPAPEKALSVIAETYQGDFNKGLAKEAKGFGEVAVTDVSKNLINLYFMTEAVKKQTGISSDAKPKEVRSLGVLGAGTMGGGIAQLGADKDLFVRIKDINTGALAKGIKAANDLFAKAVKKKRLSKYDHHRKISLISATTDYSGFKTLDVVIEAIVEDMNVKKKVLAELATQCKDDVILASNTSSLSITEMATAVPHPENFVGMHFFNPVHMMPLIEVIRGEKSSDVAVTTIFNLSKKMGKTPVIVKDGPGFLVNRLLLPYLNEACYVLGDGASIERIDKALLNFGMPMGPLHLIDEVGIDVGAKVAKILHHAFGVRAEPSPMMPKVVDAKKLGKKNQSGFYLYDSKGKKLQVDQSIYDIVGLPKPKDPFTDQEIVERCLYPMVNEASLCLEEGIVATAQDVDLGMIMGTGFPPFRGGLLRWADSVGAEQICDDLEMLSSKFGPRFKPSNPLRQMAKTNRKFYK